MPASDARLRRPAALLQPRCIHLGCDLSRAESEVSPPQKLTTLIEEGLVHLDLQGVEPGL